ncbi:jg27768, partial [Pararge aegeria aegeria]
MTRWFGVGSEPSFHLIQYRTMKESRTDVQFHLAALRGDCERLKQLLDTGKVHIDSRDR